MENARIPTAYAEHLNAYLSGGSVEPLLAMFADDACVERYVLGEPPRVFCGHEQIEESLLRLPAVGGAFHISDVQVEGRVVHAWFITENFAYPLRGTYRFHYRTLLGKTIQFQHLKRYWNRDVLVQEMLQSAQTELEQAQVTSI